MLSGLDRIWDVVSLLDQELPGGQQRHERARCVPVVDPAGLDEFFLALGVPVASRTTPARVLDQAAKAAMMAKTASLLPKYRTEMVKP